MGPPKPCGAELGGSVPFLPAEVPAYGATAHFLEPGFPSARQEGSEPAAAPHGRPCEEEEDGGAILGRGSSPTARPSAGPAPRTRASTWRPGRGWSGEGGVAVLFYFLIFFVCVLLSGGARRGLVFLTHVAGAVDKHLFPSPLPRNALGAGGPAGAAMLWGGLK